MTGLAGCDACVQQGGVEAVHAINQGSTEGARQAFFAQRPGVEAVPAMAAESEKEIVGHCFQRAGLRWNAHWTRRFARASAWLLRRLF